MNKKFSEWYRVANIEPTSELLNNRWDGIIDFIENKLEMYDTFELVRMFYGRPTQEKFRDKYVESFSGFDSAFDRNNEFELSVLAGATLVEVIENHEYKMMAMLATISFSFLEVSPVIPDILETVRDVFLKETCSAREEFLDEDDIIHKSPNCNKLLKAIKENQINSIDNILPLLSDYISETNGCFKNLYKNANHYKKIANIYEEDSQILWWMTGEWSNDLDKSFHEVKQADASLYIGKELGDKIKILPGPYSAKAVIYKMLQCCNKKNKCATVTLKDIIENADTTWKAECLKNYNITEIEEITPIMFAISKSLTVDTGDDWNPQFKKITKCSANDIRKSVEEMTFQMYLECLTVKCYNTTEE